MFKAPPRSGHFWDIARLGPPAPASEREKLSPEALALGQDALWPVLVSLFRDFVPSWGERIAHHPDIGFGLTDKLRIELCAILGAGSGPSVITGAEFSLSIYPERILAIARRRDAALLTRNQVTNPLGSLERKLGPDFTRDAWHCFDELENELIYLDSL
jgi:hypothetical protein